MTDPTGEATMPASGNGLSAQVVKEFFGLCNHTYEVWTTLRTLYDDNTRVQQLLDGPSGPFFSSLNIVMREYVLQQIAKIHDPAIQQGRANLTLEYVLRFGAWDDATKATLLESFEKLSILANRIKPARNRVLSHNDLEAILSGKDLGEFPPDADKEYFETLQCFVDVVHSKSVGGPAPFCTMASGDVFKFMKELRCLEPEGA